MKKLAVVCLVLLLISCMSLNVLAANGGFISSPSTNKDPRLVSFRPGSEDCTAQLVVTAYADRDTLLPEDKTVIETAYGTIQQNADLSKLNADLVTVAQGLEIAVESLAVSDLFDVTYHSCDHDVHAAHGAFTIQIEAETLKNFVALMHYNDGVWELVPGASVEGDILTFQADDLSPFAIVVNADADSDTGDTLFSISAAAMVVSAVAFAICLKKSKKEAE